MKDYSIMDAALERLAPFGPDLRNGLTSHAPMVVEALAAMGRADAVLPWIERYRENLLPRPVPVERIAADGWRGALGREERFADWSLFFEKELRETPWQEVVGRWVPRLAPGICASATHGVIRAGHAARSLAEGASPARIRELAAGLAYWAAAHQTLPVARGAGGLPPADAIARVAVVPRERRKFSGTITSSLAALDDFPDFAPVIDLLDVGGDPEEVISGMSETFARVLLANAHDLLGAIVFVHGVTSVVTLRSLLPHLEPTAGREALRYAWQSSCALYAAFGESPEPRAPVEPPRESRDELIDRAIECGDEHAIKVTEACLREHARRPSPAYLAAALHATRLLAAG